MLSEDTKVLEFNQYQNIAIYCSEDLECIIEKTDESKKNPKNSLTIKVRGHIPSSFSMAKVSIFRSMENKHDVYRDKDSMEKYCESLGEHATKIINFKKKKKWNCQQKNSKNHMKMQKSVTFVKKNLKINIWKIKNIIKLEIIVII